MVFAPLIRLFGGSFFSSGEEDIRKFKEKMIAELTIGDQRFNFCQIIADIVDFVHRNLEEILGDVRKNL